MADVLRAIGQPGMIAELVIAETQYVLTGGDGEDAREPELIDLSDCLQHGLAQVAAFETDEERLLFIDLATRLDDGEAMTIALAVARGWSVVTEDRKAARVAEELSLPTISCIQLVKQWIDLEGIPSSATRSILTDIRQRARWEPRRDHPYRSWWEQVLS